MTEIYIEPGKKYPPTEHPSEQVARAYASQITALRQCDVELIHNGRVVDVYTDGRGSGEIESQPDIYQALEN